MSPGSSTESYPAFAHIGLRENPGKNLNQVVKIRFRKPAITAGGDHRANHTIPPFRLDDHPPLLRHVDVRPAASCASSSRLFYDALQCLNEITGDNTGEMSLGSSTESYPAFSHIGLTENTGKNLNQTLATAEVISASPDVPEFCPAGVLLHASKSTDMSLSHLSTLKCHQPDPGSNPQPWA
ncbi:hypothetical protein ANN_18194 [Periplaneta americana]|uniref:Uncharacterized protein n=1 Tax=Periplaneta americana TaxID=6978 RepID=A0ABQ8SNK5_PERAM|nr:hypothetical protein ANN_18194 [Periplaneta americana]